MDITKIDDIKELKALAYDESVKLNIAQRNLQIIEARIAEVSKIIEELEEAKNA